MVCFKFVDVRSLFSLSGKAGAKFELFALSWILHLNILNVLFEICKLCPEVHDIV